MSRLLRAWRHPRTRRVLSFWIWLGSTEVILVHSSPLYGSHRLGVSLPWHSDLRLHLAADKCHHQHELIPPRSTPYTKHNLMQPCSSFQINTEEHSLILSAILSALCSVLILLPWLIVHNFSVSLDDDFKSLIKDASYWFMRENLVLKFMFFMQKTTPIRCSTRKM